LPHTNEEKEKGKITRPMLFILYPEVGLLIQINYLFQLVPIFDFLFCVQYIPGTEMNFLL